MPVSHHPQGLSRRRLVIAAAALPAAWLAGGCTTDDSVPDGSVSDSSVSDSSAPDADAPDPDVAVLEEATAVVDDLTRLVSRAIAERPALAPTLQPVLATHHRHAEVLGAASQSSSHPPTRPPGASSGPLPAGRAQVLSFVAEAERFAATVHRSQVRRAESGQFASLLASISAAESQLGVVVGEAAR
jgi:hypothetical protein